GGVAWRTTPFFLGRKGGAPGPGVFAVPPRAELGPPAAEEPSEPTLADIGARVGEENEALRNLLIDTDRRIGTLDDLKDAFRNLVEPIGSALQALEQDKERQCGLAQHAGGASRRPRERAQRIQRARKAGGEIGKRGRGVGPRIGAGAAGGARSRG